MKLLIFSVVFFCFLNSKSAVSQEESAGKPNIIVFIADDAGMDFGCYGNTKIKTPNIDCFSPLINWTT